MGSAFFRVIRGIVAVIRGPRCRDQRLRIPAGPALTGSGAPGVSRVPSKRNVRIARSIMHCTSSERPSGCQATP